MISSKWIIAVFLSYSPLLTHTLGQANTHLSDNGRSVRKSPRCPTRVLTPGERVCLCVKETVRRWRGKVRMKDRRKKRRSWGRWRDNQRERERDVGSIATQKWSFFYLLCSLSLMLRGSWPMTMCPGNALYFRCFCSSVECETSSVWYAHTQTNVGTLYNVWSLLF